MFVNHLMNAIEENRTLTVSVIHLHSTDLHAFIQNQETGTSVQ